MNEHLLAEQQELNKKMEKLFHIIDAEFGQKMGFVLLVLPIDVPEGPLVPTAAISNGPREWVLELIKLHATGLETGELIDAQDITPPKPTTH